MYFGTQLYYVCLHSTSETCNKILIDVVIMKCEGHIILLYDDIMIMQVLRYCFITVLVCTSYIIAL